MKHDLVHVVDDDEAVRNTLSLLLHANGYRVRPWSSGEAMLANDFDSEPACVLIDLRAPTAADLDLLEAINRRGTMVATIILSEQADVRTAVAALQRGAANFIAMPAESELLLNGIRDVLGSLHNRQAAEARRRDAIAQLGKLSPRELEVLYGVASGKQNKVIALELGISPRTVEVYRANIMEKMNCRTLAGILRIAFIAGLLEDNVIAGAA
ncbi:response regulator transcription factor [Sphingopyxis granuli]|jgi:two-component system response regulator FixJ|uniref:response regulator transcription factor n=1 Tax=Sphingopyxis granuli TaxID=267128 RepID=UPI00082F3578|nr:LuxR C-terminal-related transcriptional regulator [Sphingopyxis granuli]UNK80844.1 LuxR C-terminal-related transcriptional regulator [Sphingopyxis granuli]